MIIIFSQRKPQVSIKLMLNRILKYRLLTLVFVAYNTCYVGNVKCEIHL